MAAKMLNLFGEEEPAPEDIKAVGKSRAKKKKPTKEAAKKEKEPKDSEEWQSDKQYYAIGEVADIFHVNTSHIRFWTTEFKIKVRTTRKGDRLYTAEQINELRAIYHLVKEKGFTLQGAKAKLKTNKKTTVESVSLKQSLLDFRNLLTEIKNRL